MLLLIDIGNTRIKWALADPHAPAPLGVWHDVGAAEHAQMDSLAARWKGADVQRAIVANVAGPQKRAELERLLEVRPEWFTASAQAAGLRNGYREPARLGCDRFAAAIGARALFPARDLTVANCGTATTIDAVTAEGLFIGGMILPGLRLMAASLSQGTAQLPLIGEGTQSAAIFADNTGDAIAAGCMQAQLGAIERACAAHAKTSGDVLCVLSGGASAALAPHLGVPHAHVENMVLVGLQAYAAASPAAL
jgi:type III pantothenate kinase